MTLIARHLHILGLAALAAFGCASNGAGVVEATPSANANAPMTAPEPKTATASAPSLDPVYFDMDEAVLRTDARRALEARAQAILESAELGTVTVEGHCDERGSEEYNLALGQHRAAVVKRYLMDLGVPGSRLETVTFGESRPAVVGHDERAWRHNRRSEFTSQKRRSARR
jgi:peptidoglycan-associated lipoprotein